MTNILRVSHTLRLIYRDRNNDRGSMKTAGNCKKFHKNILIIEKKQNKTKPKKN